ncbi:MAG: dienelactone hydrolase family protein [Anaerolineae bacterium]|nr:dienelactone hydrolase family protein [Anaerolineae bacterium]
MPDFNVQIPIDAVVLEGNLTVPVNSSAVVLFAPGSGSNRFSERSQMVAQTLTRAGISTLLVDLLTPGEYAVDQGNYAISGDVPLMTRRLTAAIDWLAHNPNTRRMYTGLYGVGNGAAEAFVAAAARPGQIRAVVTRGGRADLAGVTLTQIHAATLLLVGGNDPTTLRINQEAYTALRSVKAIEVIPGATHLFEEPGAMEQVSTLTRDWFIQHLTIAPEPAQWNPVT